MNAALLFLLLAFATARVARFIHADTLIETPRNHLLTWLIEPRDGWRGAVGNKLAELLDCPWCISVWVSLCAVLVIDWGTSYSIPLPVIWVPALSMLAVMFVEYTDGVKQVKLTKD